MRTVNFRDGVLHVVADKMGLDPDQSNFLTNEAVPIGKFIDQWVRRVYDARDWPEWTFTNQFAPANHIVPWDAIPVSNLAVTILQLGRILKVFLVDPASTDAPVDTPFEIMENGIHVGYEHGQYVWIRYLAPPPHFTAVQWNVAQSYALDDTVYWYTTGECYKSRVSNNVGHDPVVSGTLTPTAPQIDTTQNRVPDSPGLAGQTEQMVVNFTGLLLPPDPTDPPPSGGVYKVYVFDVNNTLLGNSFVTADGVMTLNDVIDASVTQLIGALPGTFVVTGDHTAKTVTIEDASFFTAGAGNETTYKDTDGVDHRMQVTITQTYIPTVVSASGQPQISKITLSASTTFPGATYELTVTDSGGVKHTVEYESLLTDGSSQILQGLVIAIQASGDAYLMSIIMIVDPSVLTLSLYINDAASVNIVTTTTGSAYWDEIFFPKAIADQVIRGAYADLLKEWGQTDKGAMEEQAVPAETTVSAENFSTMPNPELTGQQRSLSRYKI